jgi:aldehyde dehydrogenase
MPSRDDAFYDKALEGFTMFALNQGEVCTCPSRALIQDSIYDRFLERRRRAGRSKIKQGNPLDTDTMIGAQAEQRPAREDPVLHRHRQAGGRQGPHRRRSRADLGGDLAGGYYVQPTVFEGTTRCASSRRRSSARSSR